MVLLAIVSLQNFFINSEPSIYLALSFVKNGTAVIEASV